MALAYVGLLFLSIKLKIVPIPTDIKDKKIINNVNIDKILFFLCILNPISSTEKNIPKIPMTYSINEKYFEISISYHHVSIVLFKIIIQFI